MGYQVSGIRYQEERGFKSFVNNHKLETANSKLRTRNCELETANSKLQTRNCKLETAVLNDSPVKQVDDPGAVSGIFFRVRHLDDGYAIVIEFLKKGHNFFALF